MKFADLQQLKEVEAVFKQHKKVFPHIRHDYLKRRVEDNQCIWDSGVVITFSVYKMKVVIGDVTMHRGSIMLHQIANKNPGNGNAGKVFQQFVSEVVQDRDLFLAVRADNKPARHFYERQGMTVAGEVKWASGKLDGVVYKLCTTKSADFQLT